MNDGFGLVEDGFSRVIGGHDGSGSAHEAPACERRCDVIEYCEVEGFDR